MALNQLLDHALGRRRASVPNSFIPDAIFLQLRSHQNHYVWPKRKTTQATPNASPKWNGNLPRPEAFSMALSYSAPQPVLV